MRLEEYADYMERLESATKDTDKQAIIREVIRSHGPQTQEEFIRAVLNEPLRDKQKSLGVGNATVKKALKRETGLSEKEAEEIIGSAPSIEQGVYELLTFEWSDSDSWDINPVDRLKTLMTEIRNFPNHSHTGAINAIQSLLTSCDSPKQAKWAIFAFLGDLNIGVGEASIKQALVDEKGLKREAVDRASALYGGVENLPEYLSDIESDISPVAGEPFQPQLAESGDGGLPMSEKWVYQAKYDGARLLIHNAGFTTRVYTRNMKEVTASLPELTHTNPVQNTIIDTEVVAVDPYTGEHLPFQKCMERLRREKDIEEHQEEVAMKAYAFDMVLHDGEDISRISLNERMERLEEYVEKIEAPIELAKTYSSPNDAFEKAVEDGHEGIIAKNMDSEYKFGQREGWVKKKPQSTLDLLVSGYEEGTGENTGQLGSLVLETSDGVEVGKVGIGFTDEQRKEWREDDIVGKIIEIEAEEIQETDDGYGLRFPRFERLRPEGEADTLDRVEEMLDG